MGIKTIETVSDTKFMHLVKIWTDGACDPNPGRGGYGAVLVCNGIQKEVWGPQERFDSFRHQSSPRMEVIAAIEALKSLTKPCRVILHSDADYLVRTMRGEFGRHTNIDLWMTLDETASIHEIEWVKVPAHAGNNQRAHTLANRGVHAGARAA